MERARRHPGWVWSRATLITDIIREGSLVIRQFVELSLVEFKLSHCDHYLGPLLPVILLLRADISNSFYSNVYLKVKQVCLEAICPGRNIAAVLPIGCMKNRSYLNCGRRAAQFHPVVIVFVSSLNALDQIDTQNIRMSVERLIHVAFSKQSYGYEDKCDIRD